MDSLILDSLSTPFALTKITTHRASKKIATCNNLAVHGSNATTVRNTFNNSNSKKIPTQGKENNFRKSLTHIFINTRLCFAFQIKIHVPCSRKEVENAIEKFRSLISVSCHAMFTAF